MKSKSLIGYVPYCWLKNFVYKRGQLGRPRKLSLPLITSKSLLGSLETKVRITIEELE